MIFVDTGAFVARYNEKDEHHRDAAPVWEWLERRAHPLVTTPLVLQETVTFLSSIATNEYAALVGRALLGSRRLRLERPTPDELDVIDELERFPVPKVSFVDCASFLAMRRLGVEYAFTFDNEHYPAAGFTVIPPVPAL